MVGPLHPVESVSWHDAAELARRLGCELPDEYAWERAIRAGTSTVYWWGDHPYGAEGLENLFDQAAAHLSIGVAVAPWDDGYIVHAPIGSFEPNPFGLYDMAGNVAEWCSNWYRSDEPPESPARRRSFRGGSWYTSPGYDDGQQVQHGAPYSAFRQADNPRGLNQTRGVRLARPLVGAERS
jgi:formylglycine-generating enzyme required for sulfatase activity